MTQEQAKELLASLILPRRAETREELDALESAARAQCEYISEMGEGVTSLSRSNDGVSVSAQRKENAFSLCAAAKAILKNAGLIRSGFPCAKPL